MTESLTFFSEELDTPTGPLSIVVDAEDRLRVVRWTDDDEPTPRLLGRLYGEGAFELRRARARSAAARAIAAYFAGDRTAIDGLRVEAPGTPFRRAVWAALRSIPCGATRSYGDIARRIGRPAAVRAVGLANHANPVAIVVPCHRVIGKDGGLTGYGGGLDRKRWLLAHEDANAVGELSA
jgi:methylated-DNA-[protein]-cysteine S-methyltransferase